MSLLILDGNCCLHRRQYNWFPSSSGWLSTIVIRGSEVMVLVLVLVLLVFNSPEPSSSDDIVDPEDWDGRTW